jgi:hypothetical protein
MTTIWEFGKELKWPFKVDERCYDCAELYGGCPARREDPDTRCPDYFQLPDAGVNGKTGQEIPPSEMGDRKKPRPPVAIKTRAQAQGQPANPTAKPEASEQDPPESSLPTAPGPDPARPTVNGAPPRDPPADQTPRRTRQPSPAGNPGPDGKRLCGCGAILPKRQRCCATCRTERRRDSKRRYRNREQPVLASGSDSDVPFPGPGRPSMPCWTGGDN